MQFSGSAYSAIEPARRPSYLHWVQFGGETGIDRDFTFKTLRYSAFSYWHTFCFVCYKTYDEGRDGSETILALKPLLAATLTPMNERNVEMLDTKKILAMIKAKHHGESLSKTWALDHWMAVPETAEERSILGCIERHLAGKPNPTHDEIIKAIDLYARP
jgi:hypothetical protein